MGHKEQEEEEQSGLDSLTAFLVCPYAFPHLERVHDEATTSDDGGDTGNQFNIATGANDHGKEANHKEASSKEGSCRVSDRTPDSGAPRTNAEPAVSDRRSQAGERR